MAPVQLLFAALFLVSGYAAIRLDQLPPAGTDLEFQYDDGVPYWIAWTGTYRGTWFDINDFYPGLHHWCLSESELWFYHHPLFPWDTASFYCELWEGGVGAPLSQLDQTSVQAQHAVPCFADYGCGITVFSQFWLIVNTEMSAGGWPSLLADNTIGGISGSSHSFWSNDFYVWTYWVPFEQTATQAPIYSMDFLIRTGMYDDAGLAPESWGAIKAIYR
ncbi:hypothetical protein JW921_00700 [Candidatus Fermentibacterales bacterium]|nr:hypothetical protein [Candidatus Fermentibacterales bacterium]